MGPLIRILIDRLARKGMEVTTIPAYIRDLGNSIAGDKASNLEELNKRLHLLGWDDIDLDDYTLQLILAVFEPDSECESSHFFDLAFKSQAISEHADIKEPVPSV